MKLRNPSDIRPTSRKVMPNPRSGAGTLEYFIFSRTPASVTMAIIQPKPEPKPELPPPPIKVEPPKPKPKPPKPVPKKPEPKKLPPKTAPVAQKPSPAVKPQPALSPAVNNKPVAAPQPVEKPSPPTPPPPKPVDISKLGALAALSGMKLDTKSTKSVPQNVTITQNATNTKTGAEVGMNSITTDLKNKTAGTASTNNASGPIKTKGTGSVGTGYGTEGIGTGTGKRGVKGAILGKPNITMGSGKTEGLSRDQVLKAMQPYLGKIQSCYERSLLSDPNLSGRIEFEWNIAPSGAVRSVDIKKNSVAGGEQLGECVTGVIKGIKFPTATNGQETVPDVGFPFGRL